MWTCPQCGCIRETIPETRKCSCGIVIASEATYEKHGILDEICEINDYNLIIDACAGSGMVVLGDKLIPGSPIRLAYLAKRKKIKCVLFESDSSTFHLLRANLRKYNLLGSSSQFMGDCNELLFNSVKGSRPTLVYIDPFGYGNPAIEKEVVVELNKKGYVDLVINFFWRTCRQMWYVKKYLNSSRSKTRLTAEAFKKSLDIYWGVGKLPHYYSDWLRWPHMHTHQYAERYARPLRGKVQVIPLPRYHKGDKFFLIFATHQNPLKLGLQKYL